MKIHKILFVLLTIIVMAISLSAVSYKSDIFTQPESWCCNTGKCENTDPEKTARCSSYSAIDLLPEPPCTNQLGGTCKDCVDLTISGCVCLEGSSFCMNDDETYYYGKYVNCEFDK